MSKPEPGAPKPHTLPLCSTCGGSTVMRDAWAIWSIEDQAWLLGAMFDAAFCETCEGETHIEIVTIEDFKRRRCRALNDALRRGQAGPHDRVMVTAGVAALGIADLAKITSAIAAFETFDEGNDPYDEHDFGATEVEGERIYFKIDYYNLDLDGHSSDPTDPSVTARVLTIMLASEY